MQNALLGKTGVYFVAAPDRDMQWMEAYYARRGIRIECRHADEIRTDSNETAFVVYDIWRVDNETGR